MSADLIDPMPPLADGALPWDVASTDPVGLFASARARHGDSFAMRSGGTTYLLLFSPAGVQSFYALDESVASKGIADWQMLRRKVPDELFAGRRTFPHELFTRDDTARYLDRLAWAIDVELDALGPNGTFEIFGFTRRLGHRMGLASWAGLEAAAPGDRFESLVAALDALDASDAFVHPERMADIAANGQAAERAALTVAESVLLEALAERESAGQVLPALVDEIVRRWADMPDERERRAGIAHDVILVHLASMSNLFAALGWMLVDLVTRPEAAARVRDGDRAWTERCALESTRLAQRSIMMRYVLQPCEVADEHRIYRVSPGVIVATLLPLTNCQAPGYEVFDPDRWQGRRLAPDHGLAARELVTAFGHGSHTCPAQPFSLAAMVRTAIEVFTRFELTPRFTDPEPLAVQIGGVARAERPCPVDYLRV